MLEWMKKFNEDSENITKIKFYGFNNVFARKSIEDALNYLDIVDKNIISKYKGRWKNLISPNPETGKTPFSFYFPQRWNLDIFSKLIDELKELMNNNKARYIGRSSIYEYEMIYQDLNITVQWIDYHQKNLNYELDQALNTRYYNMAQNVKWILDNEEQSGNDKIIVWAHNRHIAKKVSNYTSMGENLSQLFGDEYYAIGFDFYEGRFRAYGVDLWGTPISQFLAKFNIRSSSRKTFAYRLEKTGIPSSYLDFKSAAEDKDILSLLSNKQLIHDIG